MWVGWNRCICDYYNSKPSIEYQINDLVYLSTKNLALPKHRAWKLMPKFIGPYKVLKVMNDSSNIMIELPQEFKDRRINSTFHTSLVWPYIKNDDILFPKRDTKVYYNFGNNKDQEWLIEEILAHKWTNNCYEFILIFNIEWLQNMILLKLLLVCGSRLYNWHVRVAESWEFGRLLTVVSWAWAPKGQVAQNRRTALVAVSFEQ